MTASSLGTDPQALQLSGYGTACPCVRRHLVPSFSVRCLFRWLGTPAADPHTYEERITLWTAWLH